MAILPCWTTAAVDRGGPAVLKSDLGPLTIGYHETHMEHVPLDRLAAFDRTPGARADITWAGPTEVKRVGCA